MKTELSENAILVLAGFATGGLGIMWIAFWISVIRAKESIPGILASAGFFRTVTVMGIIAATAVLSLANRIDGNVTAAILSGIVGYVLGQLASSRSPMPTHEAPKDQDS
jgi:hypothetical protein